MVAPAEAVQVSVTFAVVVLTQVFASSVTEKAPGGGTGVGVGRGVEVGTGVEVGPPGIGVEVGAVQFGVVTLNGSGVAAREPPALLANTS